VLSVARGRRSVSTPFSTFAAGALASTSCGSVKLRAQHFAHDQAAAAQRL
jgi:hypothetical protein